MLGYGITISIISNSSAISLNHFDTYLRHVDVKALPLPSQFRPGRGIVQLRGSADLIAGIVAEVENPTGAPGEGNIMIDWQMK